MSNENSLSGLWSLFHSLGKHIVSDHSLSKNCLVNSAGPNVSISYKLGGTSGA